MQRKRPLCRQDIIAYAIPQVAIAGIRKAAIQIKPSPLQALELIICLRLGRFDICADAVMRILLEEVVQQGAAVSLPALIAA